MAIVNKMLLVLFIHPAAASVQTPNRPILYASTHNQVGSRESPGLVYP